MGRILRGWAAAGAAVGLVGVLGGCVASGSGAVAAVSAHGADGAESGTTTATSCVDYFALPTARERFDFAEVVVVADVGATDRTVEAIGRYRVYTAAITETLKGSLPSDAVDVISTSDQCTTPGQDVDYLQADPLDEPGSYVLYLSPSASKGTWRLVVPGAVNDSSVAATLR